MTSFANPAITVGRMFSDTFAGIAPASVPSYVVAQLVGGVCAILVVRTLYPYVTAADAAELVVPTTNGPPRTERSTNQRSVSEWRPSCSSACTTPGARK
ncbi:MAG TPA: aquaporin [Solirubrobacteraceae bacterium]|nr:aquaporin [Solirubrobacteraceae bacterium]